MRDQDLRVFLEQRGDFDGRHVLLDRVEALQRVGAQIEVDLVDQQQHAVVGVRTAGHDGDVEAVFPVGAVGERLVEAAVLGLRHPIGAERDFVEAWAETVPTVAAAADRRTAASILRDLVMNCIGCSFAPAT